MPEVHQGIEQAREGMTDTFHAGYAEEPVAVRQDANVAQLRQRRTEPTPAEIPAAEAGQHDRAGLASSCGKGWAER